MPSRPDFSTFRADSTCPLDDVVDLGLAHHVRNLVVDRRRYARDGPERVPRVEQPALVLHAGRHQLHELLAVVSVDGLGQLLELGNTALLPGRQAVVERPEAQPVRRVLLGDEQPDTALGSLLVVGDVAVAEDVVVAVGQAVRAGHHTVLDRGPADLERRPETVECGHGRILRARGGHRRGRTR